jgi:hypothetical protein
VLRISYNVCQRRSWNLKSGGACVICRAGAPKVRAGIEAAEGGEGEGSKEPSPDGARGLKFVQQRL